MNPYTKIGVKPQAMQWLAFGSIKPAGWIQAQMERDLQSGYLGHLYELVPELILKDDIYGKDRLTRSVKAKNLGVIAEETGAETQYLWWNSETQSNWRDGLIRTAFLLDDHSYLAKSQQYINHILDTQDSDGYLGIYAPDLRFNFDGENGELWAQTSLLRILLGSYEATEDHRLLEAIQRAVAVTMQSLPIFKAHPFSFKGGSGGVCHGLMFTDVLDRLFQLTSQESYMDYALWLYQEYCQSNTIVDDIHYEHLVDPGRPFHSHGVHTYEQLRSLLTAVYASSNPMLEEALQCYLEKFERCLVPSGAPIGDELIEGRSADASTTGYEYCSIHELLDSYTHLLQKTGDPAWGDRIEWLLFNAGQGARHPHEPSIAYLKTDNSTSMTGKLHPSDADDLKNPQTRYKYSPTHQDVAVCCVPNAGRIYPYYVKSMWLRTTKGLQAALFGPCEVNTVIHGVKVRISEQTEYPFSHDLIFTFDVQRPVEFELSLRKPSWVSGVEVEVDGEWLDRNGSISILKVWKPGDQVRVHF